MDSDFWTATFSYTCSLCQGRVEVVNGTQQPHGCPEDPQPTTIVISGCEVALPADWEADPDYWTSDSQWRFWED